MKLSREKNAWFEKKETSWQNCMTHEGWYIIKQRNQTKPNQLQILRNIEWISWNCILLLLIKLRETFIDLVWFGFMAYQPL